jgi:hypothetical protein
MRTRLTRTVVLCVALVSAWTGCRRAAVEEEPKPDNRKVGAAIGSVLPSVGRINPENDLKQVGLYYQTAVSQTNKPITTLDELAKTGLQREAPAIYKNFQDGRYVLCHPANFSAPSNTIVAYDHGAVEKNDAVVVVLMGDGSVQVMPAANFQAALKAQGG